MVFADTWRKATRFLAASGAGRKTSRAATGRYLRIGKTIEERKVLPPIEVHRVRPPGWAGDGQKVTERYVVDRLRRRRR